MTLQPISFSELTARQLEAIGAIYREAFEAPWEWPVEQVIGLASPAGCDPAPYHALALVDHEQPVAFAILQYLPGGNLWYLHYLAVERGQRSFGLGSALFKTILPLGDAAARAAGQPGCFGTLLEVEQVDGPPPDADREQRRRRIAFYRRHGALATAALLPRPPWAPPEMPDWEMMLAPGSAWDGCLNGVVRRRLCRSLLVEGYGRDPNEVWLKAYLDRLAPAHEPEC